MARKVTRSFANAKSSERATSTPVPTMRVWYAPKSPNRTDFAYVPMAAMSGFSKIGNPSSWSGPAMTGL